MIGTKKNFNILIGLLLFAHTHIISANIFTDFYNFMFCNGIVIKQDTEPKNCKIFQEEKNYRSLRPILSKLALKKENDLNINSMIVSGLSSNQNHGQINTVLSPLIETLFTISEYRLPFYKKNQIVTIQYLNEHQEEYIGKFKNYKTSHHIIPGDAIIIGATAVAGYFAYKLWLNNK